MILFILSIFLFSFVGNHPIAPGSLPVDSEELRTRALEEGLDEKRVATAAEDDDPVAVLEALVVEFLSNDLVGAAIEICPLEGYRADPGKILSHFPSLKSGDHVPPPLISC